MIKEIKIKDIPVEIVKDAKKEKISFLENAKNYGYFIDNKIVAVCAILYHKNFATLKSSYVLPEYRNQKIYEKMVEFRLNELKDFKIIETRAKPSTSDYFKKLGFKVIKHFNVADYLRLVK